MAEGTRPDTLADEETTEPGFALDSRAATPRSARRRVMAMAATALLVVAALVGLFFRATSDPGGAFDTLLQIYTPTPQPTFVPGANQIFIMHGVPWGVLIIDGKKIPQNDASVKGVLLTYGTHHLVYQARYFPTLRCVISAPSQPEDSCPIDSRDGESGQFISDHGLARMINLNLTSDKLQMDQYSALVQQINRMLSAKTYSTTIAPGDHYMTPEGKATTASEPLSITLQLSMARIDSRNATEWMGSQCLQFCYPPYSSSFGFPQSDWQVMIGVIERWSITDVQGNTTVLSYPTTNFGLTQTLMQLGIQLTGSKWNISGLDQPDRVAVTSNAMAMANHTLINQPQSQGSMSVNGFSLVLSANPLDGCVIPLMFSSDESSKAKITSRVLWRFGAVVALDDTAHTLYPWLPIASATDQAVANRILQQAQGAG